MITIKLKKIYFFLTILLFIQGCSRLENKQTNIDENYIIKNFTLKQHKSNGNIHWDIMSKEAYYNEYKQTTNAELPIVKIYKKNIPEYKITSNILDIYENGNFIIFNNEVEVYYLIDNNILISAKKVEWFPNKNLLKFIGSSKLTKLDKYIDSNHRLILLSNNFNWNTLNGEIKASGPIQANTYINEIKKEKITGKKLTGNIKKNNIFIKNCLYRNNKIYSQSDKCKINWKPNSKTETIFSKSEVDLQSEEDFVKTKIIINSPY